MKKVSAFFCRENAQCLNKRSKQKDLVKKRY